MVQTRPGERSPKRKRETEGERNGRRMINFNGRCRFICGVSVHGTRWPEPFKKEGLFRPKLSFITDGAHRPSTALARLFWKCVPVRLSRQKRGTVYWILPTVTVRLVLNLDCISFLNGLDLKQPINVFAERTCSSVPEKRSSLLDSSSRYRSSDVKPELHFTNIF